MERVQWPLTTGACQWSGRHPGTPGKCFQETAGCLHYYLFPCPNSLDPTAPQVSCGDELSGSVVGWQGNSWGTRRPEQPPQPGPCVVGKKGGGREGRGDSHQRGLCFGDWTLSCRGSRVLSWQHPVASSLHTRLFQHPLQRQPHSTAGRGLVGGWPGSIALITWIQLPAGLSPSLTSAPPLPAQRNGLCVCVCVCVPGCVCVCV